MPGVIERRYSETTAQRIDDAVRELIDAAFGKAVGLLNERHKTLEKAAQELLAKETLTGEELTALFGGEGPQVTQLVSRRATSPVSI
jgi:cell division protease FtsH